MSAAAAPARVPAAALLGGLAVFSAVALLLGPLWGSESIEKWTAWTELLQLDRADWSVHTRILNLRLPRVALAWLAGGTLAVCGAVLQTLLRNGLATPYTLGVSSAASFGAFLSIAWPGLLPLGAGLSLRLGALVFALAEAGLVLAVARRARRADGLILAGVVFNFLFGAATMLVRYLADPYELASMDRWLMGSLQAVTAGAPLALLPWLGVGLLLIAWRTSALDQLAFDEELAAARGVPVRAVRRDLLLATGLLTAAVVAQCGPIGFLGLLVPHALRPFAGLRHGILLPACFLAGGGFLVFADLAARSLELLGRHSEVPVGILTALLGAPFFLLLLLRSRF
ncbi:MAG TPA: iron ABC transporter permease [Planctomycetota bacterium]